MENCYSDEKWIIYNNLKLLSVYKSANTLQANRNINKKLSNGKFSKFS